MLLLTNLKFRFLSIYLLSVLHFYFFVINSFYLTCILFLVAPFKKNSLSDSTSNKETQGDNRSNLAYFVHISNISNIALDKKLIKFILLFNSKIKFCRVHKKCLTTHLKVISINYVRDTKQKS